MQGIKKGDAVTEEYSIKRLLALRRVTRAAAGSLASQCRDVLQTIHFPTRPRMVLGEYIASGSKESVRGADGVFSEFKAIYESVSAARPFGLRMPLTSPLVNLATVPEIAAWEYTHEAKSDQGNKSISVTSPLRWVLHFSPYPPRKVLELIAARDQSTAELQLAVIHYVLMQILLKHQPGLMRLFAALRMPIEIGRYPGCGELPVPIISSEVRTLLPPDPVLVESTEISGQDAFEEIVDLPFLRELADPLKTSLNELLQKEPELRE
jgi:hypothetical protein